MANQPLTTGQAAAQLGVPEWKLRRVVDEIAPETPRIGGQAVRAIDPAAMKTLADELWRQGYIAKRPG